MQHQDHAPADQDADLDLAMALSKQEEGKQDLARPGESQFRCKKCTFINTVTDWRRMSQAICIVCNTED